MAAQRVHHAPAMHPDSRHTPRRRWLAAGSALSLLLFAACAEEAAEPGTLSWESVVPYEGFEQGFYLPINDLLLVDQAGIQVTANGNVALSFAGSSFDGTLDVNDELDDYTADVAMNGAITLELFVEGAGALTSELDLFTLRLPQVTFGPVTVTPFAQGRMRLNGTADANARVSMVAPFRVGASFDKNAAQQAQSTSTPRFEPELGKPELAGSFHGTVDVEVTMAFMTSIGIFPVGGPVIGPRFGVALDADTMNWNLDGDVEVVGGWAFPDATGEPNLPDELEELVNPPPWNIAGGAIPNLGPSTRWSQAYDVVNDDDAGAAALFGNRAVVVETDDSPWLASIDDTGVRWQREETTGWIPKSIVKAQNGDVLIAGVSSSTTDIRVERYTAGGTPRWSNTMTVPGAVLRLCPPQSVRCDGILPTASNGAIVSGQVTYPSGDPRLIFAAIDQNGNITWSTELEMGAGSTEPVVHALAETATGDILAAGTIDYSDGLSIDGKNALILRLDANGNPLSARAVGGLHDQGANQLAVFPDGTYAIAGDAGAFAPFGVWIASLDATDNLVWSGSYQNGPADPNVVDISTVTGISPLANHGLLVSGYFGAPNPNGWIFRINQNGMPVWVKTYISADEDKIVEVLALPDGLMAFGETGFTETVNGSYTDLWLLRTSVDGMLHFINGNGFDAENTDAQWQLFPPAEHSVHTLAPAPLASATLTGTPTVIMANVGGAGVETLTY
jgi:hypothetical protein